MKTRFSVLVKFGLFFFAAFLLGGCLEIENPVNGVTFAHRSAIHFSVDATSASRVVWTTTYTDENGQLQTLEIGRGETFDYANLPIVNGQITTHKIVAKRGSESDTSTIYIKPRCLYEGMVDCSHLNSGCVQGACDPVPDQCVAVPDDALCDDGGFCNGNEICDVQTGQCESGEAVICDDGDPCTTDICREESEKCVFSEVNCDDGISCTTDACDAASGACSHEFHDEFCDSGPENTKGYCTQNGCVYEESLAVTMDAALEKLDFLIQDPPNFGGARASQFCDVANGDVIISTDLFLIRDREFPGNLCIDGAKYTMTSLSTPIRVTVEGNIYVENGGELYVTGGTWISSNIAVAVGASSKITARGSSTKFWPSDILLAPNTKLEIDESYVRLDGYWGIYGEGNTEAVIDNGGRVTFWHDDGWLKSGIAMAAGSSLWIGGGSIITQYALNTVNDGRMSAGAIYSLGDVRIADSTINYFSYGVAKSGSGNLEVTNSTIYNSSIVPIFLNDMDDTPSSTVLIEGNDFVWDDAIDSSQEREPYFAIGMYSCDDADTTFTIRDNTILTDPDVWFLYWGLAVRDVRADLLVSFNNFKKFRAWGMEFNNAEGIPSGQLEIREHSGNDAIDGLVHAVTGAPMSYGAIKIVGYTQPNLSQNTTHGPNQLSGVFIERTEGANLEATEVRHPGWGPGIMVQDSPQATLRYSDIYDISRAGIRLYNSRNAKIQDTIVTNQITEDLSPNDGGIYLEADSSFAEISGAILTDLIVAMQISDSDEVNIEDINVQGFDADDSNSWRFLESGISIANSENVSLRQVEIRDIYFGISASASKIRIESEVKVLCVESSEQVHHDGVGLTLDQSDLSTVSGLLVSNKNCEQYEAKAGIFIMDSDDVIVKENETEFMHVYGIMVKKCKGSKLSSNTIRNTPSPQSALSGVGYYIAECSEMGFGGNIISGADIGIQLIDSPSGVPLRCNDIVANEVGLEANDSKILIGEGSFEVGNRIDAAIDIAYNNTSCSLIPATYNYWGGGMAVSRDNSAPPCHPFPVDTSNWTDDPDKICQGR